MPNPGKVNIVRKYRINDGLGIAKNAYKIHKERIALLQLKHLGDQANIIN